KICVIPQNPVASNGPAQSKKLNEINVPTVLPTVKKPLEAESSKKPRKSTFLRSLPTPPDGWVTLSPHTPLPRPRVARGLKGRPPLARANQMERWSAAQ